MCEDLLGEPLGTCVGLGWCHPHFLEGNTGSGGGSTAKGGSLVVCRGFIELKRTSVEPIRTKS